MKILGLASDHAGFAMKCLIKEHLLHKGFNIIDYGCDSDASCDYPDYAHKLGQSIDNEDVDLGFVFCGSGNGISMTINKHPNVRAAICWNPTIASLARHHNNANVCSLPARFINNNEALEIVDIFLSEDFDGGRHLVRIDKIPIYS